MILATQTLHAARVLGHEGAIELLASVGFDALDLTLFDMPRELFGDGSHIAYARKLGAKARECGVFFTQAHAPYPTLRGDPDYDKEHLELTRVAIEVAGELGASAIVVHPVKHLLPFEENREALFELNMQMYSSLAATAREVGTKIALENMFTRNKAAGRLTDAPCSDEAEFCRYLDTLRSDSTLRDSFIACLDIGHCGLVDRDPASFIRALGKDRLGALHVHDNDLVDDNHTMPYLGKNDWESITSALAEIDYCGAFTFETHKFTARFPRELLSTAEKTLHDVGRELISKIETKKSYIKQNRKDDL